MIDEIYPWNCSDTVIIQDGYDRKVVMAPSAQNMNILMDKINECAVEINRLTEASKGSYAEGFEAGKAWRQEPQ